MSYERDSKEQYAKEINKRIKDLWEIDRQIWEDGGRPEYGLKCDKDGYYSVEKMPEGQTMSEFRSDGQWHHYMIRDDKCYEVIGGVLYEAVEPVADDPPSAALAAHEPSPMIDIAANGIWRGRVFRPFK